MFRGTRALSRVSLVALAALVLGVMTSPARADNPAISGASASFGFLSSHQTIGWQFSTNNALTVDALGYLDVDTNGLETTHQVGIWDSTGALLTSATVDAGTVDPVLSFFRYKSITPYLLPGGHTYTIGGTAGYLPPARPVRLLGL